MKTKLTLLASTAVAAMLLATPANAAGSGWYVSLSGGANWMSEEGFIASTTTDTLTFSPDSDAGWIVAGAVGLSLDNVVKGLRAEAEVGYRQHQVDGVWASSDGGTDSGTLDYDHSTLSIMANVWYDFSIAGVDPYIGGGIGWAESELDGLFVGGDVPAFTASESGFAWQLGAGINFDIAPNMKLGVGYRYMEAPEVSVGAPSLANGVAGDVESGNHAALVSLTFGM
jgi:opacity protein-like surface antigen